jgi:hypothetical protein
MQHRTAGNLRCIDWEKRYGEQRTERKKERKKEGNMGDTRRDGVKYEL